jgi:hypothetical protein
MAEGLIAGCAGGAGTRRSMSLPATDIKKARVSRELSQVLILVVRRETNARGN